MNTVGREKFAVKPLVAAVALAVSSVTAYAAPTLNQLPGAGIYQAGTAGTTLTSGAYGVAAGAVGAKFQNAAGGLAVINVDGVANGRAVINWGAGLVGPGNEVTNPAGFNLGASAKLGFTADAPGAAVLNIDSSGTPSEIYGVLASIGKFGIGNPQIFVSNANGIFVSASGQISVASTIGLLGADLDNALAKNDFIRNNKDGVSYINVNTGQAPVTIGGNLNGALLTNDPALAVLVAGGDVTNTGNIFANNVDIFAGMRQVATLAEVNLVPAVVHRLWNSTTQEAVSCCGTVNLEIASPSSFVNTGSISAFFDGKVGGNIFVEAAVGNRTGTLGDLDVQVGLFADTGVHLDTYTPGASGGKTEVYNVVSGYLTNKTLPTFLVNTFGGTQGDVTVHAIPFGKQPATIQTLGPVLIKGDTINIDSTINSEVDTLATPAVSGGDGGTSILATTALNITASVGSADNVKLGSDGTLAISKGANIIGDTEKLGIGGIEINVGGDAAISGNLTTYSDGDTYSPPDSGVQITVGGNLLLAGDTTAQGNPTTVGAGPYNGSAVDIVANFISGHTVISGNIDAYDHVHITADLLISGNINSSNSDIIIVNPDKSASASTVISGTLTAADDVSVATFGSLTMTNTVNAGDNVIITNLGAGATNTTTISGDVTAADNINIVNAPLVTGNLNISGTLTATGGEVNVFSGGNLQLATVNADDDINILVGGTTSKLSGPMTAGDTFFYTAPLATTKLLPAAVITADEVNLINVLNFVGVNDSGNTYLTVLQKPAFQIQTNLLNIHIQGTINAPILGNTFWLTNSMVVKPNTPLLPVFTSITADGGSFQAINLKFLGDAVVNSWETTTPFIDVGLSTGDEGLGGGLQGNSGSSMILNATGALFVAPGSEGAFQFPGGLSFNGGTLVDIGTPVYNAFTTAAVPFQGVWVYVGLGGVINSSSFFATSGNSWVNFNQRPSTASLTGGPTVYRIHGVGSPVPTLFGFVDETGDALHQNNYPSAISGFPINTTPIGPLNPWGPPLLWPTPI